MQTTITKMNGFVEKQKWILKNDEFIQVEKIHI